MKQYIDKAAVVAEIEKRINEYNTPVDRLGSNNIRLHECKDILSFLDTLEVKGVDLEKEIDNEIDSLSNLYCYMEDLFNGNEEEGVYPIPENVKNELFEFAKYFFELGIKGQKGK